ncbi:MAG: GspH/FimT family pseudopilin [Pseudoxanthomonas sp.]
MRSVHLRNNLVGRRRPVQGVSLLEMLLVVALIAIAAMIAAAIFTGGLAGMQLRSSSKEIAAQLRYTRAQAIATGAPQAFVIQPGSHRWQGANERHGEVPSSLRVEFTGARQVQAAPGAGSIVFFPDGASTGGRVQLSAKQAAWRIDVAWLTGEVRLARAPAGSTAP